MRYYLTAAVFGFACAVLTVTMYNRATAPDEIASAEPSIVDTLDTVVAQALDADQGDDWSALRSSGSALQVLAYLSDHPASPHRQEALARLEDLFEAEQVTRNAPNLLGLPTSEAPFNGVLDSTFLAALFNSEPKYPPIEGLPDALWKNQTCKNCHKWTVSMLCDQAGTYQQAHFDPATETPHPFGVEFKVALRKWSEAGCR